jgi:hypothetical protein
VKKIGMTAITVAALLSLSHARADDITGDILHEGCIVAIMGLAATGIAISISMGLQQAFWWIKSQGNKVRLSVFRLALRRTRFAMLSKNSCRRTQTCCTSTGLPPSESHLARHFHVRNQIRANIPDLTNVSRHAILLS